MRVTGWIQDKDYSCGPAALRAILAWNFNKYVPEYVLRYHSNCNQEGTDEEGLISAVERAGFSSSPAWVQSGEYAWKLLRSTLLKGHGALLCTEDWGHWVAAVGYRDCRVVVIDPDTGIVKTWSKHKTLHKLMAKGTGYKKNIYFIKVEP